MSNKNIPIGSQLKTLKIKKKELLNSIKDRLEKEVGVIISLLNEHNSKNSGVIGFWACARMIFPIIEATSNYLGIEREIFLKDKLGIKTPNLAWIMFRNSLIHGETPCELIYKNKKIEWAIFLDPDPSPHIIGSSKIMLSISRLYTDMYIFLENEIKKTTEEELDIVNGIEFLENGTFKKDGKRRLPQKKILEEFKVL